MFKFNFRTSIDLAAYMFLLWFIARTVTFYFVPQKTTLSRYQRAEKAYVVIVCIKPEFVFSLAQQLILHGFAVLLLTDDVDELRGTVQKLRSETSNPFVDVIHCSMSGHNADDLTAALEPVTRLPITMLINCLNGLNARTRYQTSTSDSAEDVEDMIDRGVRFTSQISRLILPILIRNGPSIILHILSEVVDGYPYMSTYSGVQGFAMSHAAAIRREAKAEGWQLDSLAIITGDWHARDIKSETARHISKRLLGCVELAVDRGMVVTRPYWVDALQHKLLQAFPERLLQALFQGNRKSEVERVVKKD